MNGITDPAKRIAHVIERGDRSTTSALAAHHSAAPHSLNSKMSSTLAGLSEIERGVASGPSSLTRLLRAQMFARRGGSGDASNQAKEIMESAEDKLDDTYLRALQRGASPADAAKEALEQLGGDEAGFSVLAAGATMSCPVRLNTETHAPKRSIDTHALQRAAARVRTATAGAINNAAEALTERLVLRTRTV